MKHQEQYKEKIDQILIREKRYRDPEFSAKELSEMLGISVFQLSRLVRSAYDKSYSNLVHEYRIQDAMRMLRDKRYDPYTVDDIGFSVGFGNRQSFYNAFNKAAGTTPSLYRNQGEEPDTPPETA
ncbi:MAG: AraC family transcriptional regulator [Bacteroidales bacterium]|nr:AraC family transcriptional regulator [Bacteroidales bacterium]